jgi:hypothetical protein
LCPNSTELSFGGDTPSPRTDGNAITLNVFLLDGLLQRLALQEPDWGRSNSARPSPTSSKEAGRGPDHRADTAGNQWARRGARADLSGHGWAPRALRFPVAIQLVATRPNGREVAVRYTAHSSACEDVDSVAVINLANSARRDMPQPASEDSWRTASIARSSDEDLLRHRDARSRRPQDPRSR